VRRASEDAVRIGGDDEGIEVDGECLVLRWKDVWSTDAARRALSPRRIPLTAVHRLEYVASANMVRVHLHGEDPSRAFSPATSVNAVPVSRRNAGAAIAFAEQVNELLAALPSVVADELVGSVVRQVEDARRQKAAKAPLDGPRGDGDTRRDWHASPAGRARTARALGHRWHEHMAPTAPSSSEQPELGPDVVGEIEREGWELAFVDHLWRPLPPGADASRRGAEGEIVAIYMFRAADREVRAEERRSR
jgi:hypothetical protein